ncbi:MAG: hypothetical protein QOE70_6214 [Chthoniobacter sp.]|jgi:hypothetical protein|nr:hypothetical protein [Chthoniobacter sp.]
MASLAAELTNEFEFTPGGAHETAHASFHEGEAEEESFFNHLAAMADRGGRSQALRRIGLAAARAAMSARRTPWPIIEGESHEAAVALELEWNAARRTQADAHLEHLGHAAAEATSAQEAAEHFLPLIPLAARVALPLAMRVLPQAARLAAPGARRLAPAAISRVAPQLTRGVGNVAQVLFRNPATRPLLHALPRIARGTMADVLRRYASTGAMTPQTALRLLARRTANVIQSPATLAQSYRRSRAADARFHRGAAQTLGIPASARPRVQGPLARSTATRASVSMAAPIPGGCRCRCCGR